MIFLDSSIIIEGLKKESIFKDAKKLLEIVVLNYDKFYVNEIVFDEVLYWLIKKKINLKKYSKILLLFKLKTLDEKLVNLWIEFIDNYKLKPHDALILATCKYYGIPYLLSLDEDFRETCEKEGITLIDSVEKLKEVLNKT